MIYSGPNPRATLLGPCHIPAGFSPARGPLFLYNNGMKTLKKALVIAGCAWYLLFLYRWIASS